MRRGAVFERVEHTGETRRDLLGRIAGNSKGLVHDVRAVIADRPRGELDPIADDVVLIRRNLQRILMLERREPAPRHRERIVTELDLAGLLVALVHREIGNPAELEAVLGGETEFLADLEPRGAGERAERTRYAGDEKHRVAVAEAECGAQRFGPLGPKAARDRPGALAITEEDIGQARLAFVLGPGIHPVAKGSVAAARRRDRPHPHIRVRGDHAGENAEPRAAERLGHVPDHDRVAQIGLVAGVVEDRVGIGDAGERRRADPAVAAEFFEYAMQYRLDRRKDILLRYVRHLEIELVELAGGAVGAARLVPEAWGDLEIPVEPGDHQQLLELLWRLRQRVELAGMKPARHQVIARPLGRAGGQDRR